MTRAEQDSAGDCSGALNREGRPRWSRAPAAESLWGLPDESAPRESRHIPALDGVRGLAILLVIAFHHTFLDKTTPVDRVFARLAAFGWCGVDLFFVLSGFLITGILYDSKSGAHYFRNFYMRRVLRIFPLYYAVVFFSLVILPAVFPHSDLAVLGRMGMQDRSSVWYWLYLSNFLTVLDERFHHPILALSWSLAIEEQFYLAWPLVVWLLRRRTLLWLCPTLVVLALLMRTTLVLMHTSPIVIYVLPFSRMDALAIGAWIAIVARGERGWSPLIQPARILAPLSAAPMLGLALSTDSYAWMGRTTQSVGYTLLALFFGSLLVLAVTSEPRSLVARFFGWRALHVFGKYSYALYLIHVPIRRVIRDNLFRVQQFPTVLESQLPGQLIFYVIATVPALLLAWMSWHGFEKQILKAKRFFPYGRVDDARRSDGS